MRFRRVYPPYGLDQAPPPRPSQDGTFGPCGRQDMSYGVDKSEFATSAVSLLDATSALQSDLAINASVVSGRSQI
jgi:hypothetical protein